MNRFDGHFAYLKTLDFYFKGDPERRWGALFFLFFPPIEFEFLQAQLCCFCSLSMKNRKGLARDGMYTAATENCSAHSRVFGTLKLKRRKEKRVWFKFKRTERCFFKYIFLVCFVSFLHSIPVNRTHNTFNSSLPMFMYYLFAFVQQ